LQLAPAKARFSLAVQDAIQSISDNSLTALDDRGELTLDTYSTLLTTLFHQTRDGPYSFALAAVNCDWRFEKLKEYLLKHAYEEHTHWKWVLDDLESINYAGPSPHSLEPHPTTAAYLQLNREVAAAFPPARLAIAVVLEGFAAHAGKTLVPRLLKTLGLNAKNASFMVSHGITDVGHSDELEKILDESPISAGEWEEWMTPTATRAGSLYRAMLCHEGYATRRTTLST
jgi:hypothetical protein